MAIEADPPTPRPGVDPSQPVVKPFFGIDLASVWRYHLPQWEDTDAFLWTMIARASHAPDITFFNQVLGTTGMVQDSLWVPPPNDSQQLYAFGKMSDVNYVVIAATTTELEELQYIFTHALGQIYTDPVKGWQINASWIARATPIVTAYRTWEPRATQPVVVIGHSAGGAYAAAFALSLTDLQPTTPVCVVTVGAPVWTLQQTRNLLGKAPQFQLIEFANPQDFIAYVPPSGSVLNRYYLGSENVFPLIFTRLNALLGLSHSVHFEQLPTGLSTQEVEIVLRQLLNGTLNVAVHYMRVYTAASAGWALKSSGNGAFNIVVSNLEAIRQAMDAANIN